MFRQLPRDRMNNPPRPVRPPRKARWCGRPSSTSARSRGGGDNVERLPVVPARMEQLDAHIPGRQDGKSSSATSDTSFPTPLNSDHGVDLICSWRVWIGWTFLHARTADMHTLMSLAQPSGLPMPDLDSLRIVENNTTAGMHVAGTRSARDGRVPWSDLLVVEVVRQWNVLQEPI